MQPVIQLTNPSLWRRAVWPLSLLLLAGLLLQNAWVVDDAYISFRTAENLVQGRGLTWNPGERVQAFTHPLWLLVVAAARSLSGEFFFTVIALSLGLTLASLWLAANLPGVRRWWLGPLLALGLAASKAPLDYASSGLETPLTYLFVVVFLRQLLAGPRLLPLTLLAGLAWCNRQDTLLLFLPGLAWALWQNRLLGWRVLLRQLALASAPAWLWATFALWYFGSILPNTVYAKLACTGLPPAWRLQRGLEYLLQSLQTDLAAWLLLALAAVLAWRQRSVVRGLALAGAGLYVLSVVASGASATHMAGRFFAVPLLVGLLTALPALPNGRQAGLVAALLLAWLLHSPVSPLKFGTFAYDPGRQSESALDVKFEVLHEGAALLNYRPGLAMPAHAWLAAGQQLRQSGQTLQVGGLHGKEAVGYFAFAAGPAVTLVDLCGLTDPLLARLPAALPQHIDDWKSGHFHRPLPAGYLDSLQNGRPNLANPQLQRAFERVWLATRAPLLAPGRLQAILELQLQGCLGP